MRDPMSWSIPLFRAFGIQVKLHILYIVITVGMLLKVWTQPGGKNHLAEFALIWVVMLFLIILLHEFGHCFAARKVDGEADEILMWPLGGLAYCSVPHTPRANFITAAGGPMVNVLICVVTGAALAAASYYPPVNIFNTDQLYHPNLRNWQTGDSAVPLYGDSPYFFDRETGKPFTTRDAGTVNGVTVARHPDTNVFIPADHATARLAVYPSWVLWTARLFWLSWFLLVINLVPAFPLDGGRLLQAIVWGRTGDYRAGTQIACWSGLAVSLGFLLLAFWSNDAMLLFLGLFVMFTSYQQLVLLDHTAEERGAFGYDFSKGYGGFGPDEETPPPKVKRPGMWKRWALARRAKKMQREAEQRAADEARLDELLDKIGRLGKESLTAEEKRFMDRVSQRYRNRP
ncbi:MAG TPA: site-2 protease family protein [Gemmataceae bacterium]|jgi:stage IV sporulation protein FB|nr:site-2 protease family protein [Gemmataceae bacterium]